MKMQPRACDRCDMDHMSSDMDAQEHWMGILPREAPLANPFVPYQRNNPPTYPAGKGARRGTLFPGLDLPYRGMVNEGTLSDSQLQELQSLAFAITELGEYLDTHKDDREAFALMKSYAELYRSGMEKYEAAHGPLTQKAAAQRESYDWLNDPWPWEYEANKEG